MRALNGSQVAVLDALERAEGTDEGWKFFRGNIQACLTDVKLSESSVYRILRELNAKKLVWIAEGYSSGFRLWQYCLRPRGRRELIRHLSEEAVIWRQVGRRRKAQRLYERMLEIYDGAREPEHPGAARIRQDFARLLREMGRGEEAEKQEARARAIRGMKPVRVWIPKDLADRLNGSMSSPSATVAEGLQTYFDGKDQQRSKGWVRRRTRPERRKGSLRLVNGAAR